MVFKIWKYELKVTDDIQKIMMPVSGKILHVDMQGEHNLNTIHFWALVNPDEIEMERRFIVYGTGHPITHKNLKHLGTVLWEKGQLVWHVFELVR